MDRISMDLVIARCVQVLGEWPSCEAIVVTSSYLPSSTASGDQATSGFTECVHALLHIDL
jgi:hypothetical protein